MNTRTTGPKNRKEATALVARHLIEFLSTAPVDEMLHVDLSTVKMTDVQVQRLEDAVQDIKNRLLKLAGE